MSNEHMPSQFYPPPSAPTPQQYHANEHMPQQFYPPSSAPTPQHYHTNENMPPQLYPPSSAPTPQQYHANEHMPPQFYPPSSAPTPQQYHANEHMPPQFYPPSSAPTPPQYNVNVQPQPMISAGQWSTGLCDCGSDVCNCCLTCWCPCITFGQIAEITDRGTTSCGVHGTLYTLLILLTGCQWIYSCMYRSKMRQQYMLSEEPCNDCLVHFFCEPCAICQEYRELQHCGFDMYLGWHGNMERQNHAVVMPPVFNVEMKR